MADCHSIFILPPSLVALRERLGSRGQDSEAVIGRRMHDAQAEISHWNEFTHLVVNDRFEEALAELRSIIDCCRNSISCEQKQYPELVANLLGNR